MRVALIGAGRMGSAMGGRIVEAGHDLVVFNRTRPRAAEVAQRIGGRVAETASAGSVIIPCQTPCPATGRLMNTASRHALLSA